MLTNRMLFAIFGTIILDCKLNFMDRANNSNVLLRPSLPDRSIHPSRTSSPDLADDRKPS